jgi:hypothetical protein
VIAWNSRCNGSGGLLQLGNGLGIDADESDAAALVQRHRMHLVQQALDHTSQSQQLRRIRNVRPLDGVIVHSTHGLDARERIGGPAGPEVPANGVERG